MAAKKQIKNTEQKVLDTLIHDIIELANQGMRDLPQVVVELKLTRPPQFTSQRGSMSLRVSNGENFINLLQNRPVWIQEMDKPLRVAEVELYGIVLQRLLNVIEGDD